MRKSPRTDPITLEDKDVEFITKLGPLEIKKKFKLGAANNAVVSQSEARTRVPPLVRHHQLAIFKRIRRCPAAAIRRLELVRGQRFA